MARTIRKRGQRHPCQRVDLQNLQDASFDDEEPPVAGSGQAATEVRATVVDQTYQTAIETQHAESSREGLGAR